MKRVALLILALFLAWNVEAKPGVQAVNQLVERVCGKGASSHFVFTLTGEGGDETFTIAPDKGRVAVKGSSLSALTAGLNWYLNHYAGVNISWSNLSQRVEAFPLPEREETHSTSSRYRYYLNYCTFSYSMAFWDWERWQQEIDWMALHGINLPLMAVGMDAVWYDMLTRDFGFSNDEASAFVAGPAFQGWWLMNNLQGHGGPNPKWWYVRQAKLGRDIVKRMKELGMQPCIPGFVGMAPKKYVDDCGAQAYDGDWCGFPSPLLMQPGQAFDRMAKQYYKHVKRIYGFTPEYYSMDPVHERWLPSGMGQDGYRALCDAARLAMDSYGGQRPVWVAQMWQVNADQHRIDALPVQRTLLLDLSSERGMTYESRFEGREYVFCMLHNYGGNIGMYGCAQKMLDEYYRVHRKNANLVGFGATPEGIETNPVMYELLFELPWHSDVVTAKDFFADYPRRRYGAANEKAVEAWQLLLNSVYSDNDQNQQGCREPVFCARPNLRGDDASAWAGAKFDWPSSVTRKAAQLLVEAGLSGKNYEYDVVDVTRQALSDYGHDLQMEMARALDSSSKNSNNQLFEQSKSRFLELMDDIDTLLGTVEDFRLGRWVGAARAINAQDADWLEMNARKLITTWSTGNSSLHDYANRQYQGLMRDYYKPRWEGWFANRERNDWSETVEQPFVSGKTAPYGKYAAGAATGNAVETARRLLEKYFSTPKPAANGQPWPDTDGNHINAHGGMVMQHEGLWYWWGEDRPSRGFTTEVGVSVYTSPDLKTWTRRGTALSVSEGAGSDIERGCIMERPKVLYCRQTGKWVMLFHLELKGRGYEAARVGFAVADRPEGPFAFIRSLRPNAGRWPMDFTDEDIARAKALDADRFTEWWTPEWRKAVAEGLLLRENIEGGQMSRDMTVFVDDDGKAYHIYSAEENLTLNVAELTPDFLGYTGRYVRIAPSGQNEAPAILKRDGVYWLITSGCTGWAPNTARMFFAKSIWGPWEQVGTPFVGEGADKTFGGQGTYIFNNGAQYIFMADVWNPKHLRESRHLWLPIDFTSHGVPVIEWQE